MIRKIPVRKIPGQSYVHKTLLWHKNKKKWPPIPDRR